MQLPSPYSGFPLGLEKERALTRSRTCQIMAQSTPGNTVYGSLYVEGDIRIPVQSLFSLYNMPVKKPKSKQKTTVALKTSTEMS